MSLLKKAFPTREHVLLVVVHVGLTLSNTEQDMEAALQNGADGVLLIKDYEHEPQTNTEDVVAAYHQARRHYPNEWVGINMLGYTGLAAALHMPKGCSGLWLDNPRVTEEPDGSRYLEEVQKKFHIMHLPYSPLLLASVAFKGQEPVKDPAYVAALAEPYCDVVVTSGNDTGVAPSLEKLRAMSQVLTKTPLGNASGSSALNIVAFKKAGVRVFMMNTSISDSKTHRLVPHLVAEAAQLIHA